jgi:hypothetical protein
VLLVSVQELAIERDSLPLHVLSGVPEAGKRTLAELLKAEPALWPRYGGWLAGREPAIWQEIWLMAAQQEQQFVFDVGPLVASLKETGGLKQFIEAVGLEQFIEAMGLEQFIEAVGIKQAIEAVGAEQVLAAVGPEQFLARVSPEQREELRRLLTQRDTPDSTNQPK